METDRRFDLVVPAAVLGCCLALGLVLGGWVQGSQIKAIKLSDRYVTVKGLVERTVKSDMALWPLTFSEAGTDLPTVLDKSEQDKQAVLQFFAAHGVTQQEITVGQIEVTDKLANQYGGNINGPRYIVRQTVTVSSTDVGKIAAVGQETVKLVQAGVVLGGGYGQGIKYVFNGLNQLKPDMITEATRNARESATRFAADSGSQVGTIRSANQGAFSISAADGSQGSVAGEDGVDGGPGGANADASIMKKVRVVATVEYYLVR